MSTTDERRAEPSAPSQRPRRGGQQPGLGLLGRAMLVGVPVTSAACAVAERLDRAPTPALVGRLGYLLALAVGGVVTMYVTRLLARRPCAELEFTAVLLTLMVSFGLVTAAWRLLPGLLA